MRDRHQTGEVYVLNLKRNQGKLHDDIRHLYEVDREDGFKETPFDQAQTVNKDHSRIDIRNYWVTAAPQYLDYVDRDCE